MPPLLVPALRSPPTGTRGLQCSLPASRSCGQPHVADFTAEVGRALVQPAVKNEPCAHSRAEGEKNHVPRAPPRSVAPFCQCARASPPIASTVSRQGRAPGSVGKARRAMIRTPRAEALPTTTAVLVPPISTPTSSPDSSAIRPECSIHARRRTISGEARCGKTTFL